MAVHEIYSTALATSGGLLWAFGLYCLQPARRYRVTRELRREKRAREEAERAYFTLLAESPSPYEPARVVEARTPLPRFLIVRGQGRAQQTIKSMRFDPDDPDDTEYKRNWADEICDMVNTDVEIAPAGTPRIPGRG